MLSVEARQDKIEEAWMDVRDASLARKQILEDSLKFQMFQQDADEVQFLKNRI